MDIKIGDKVTITTDNYFVAPDGKQYKAVFGTVKGVYDAKDVLGIKPNGRSTNWYVEVGNMILAGCQIHYLVKTKIQNFGAVTEDQWGSGVHSEFTRKTIVYNADEEMI